MKRRQFIFSGLSLFLLPFISRAARYQDVPFGVGEVFNRLPLKQIPDTVGWQVSVDFLHRYEQLRSRKILLLDEIFLKWEHDELKQRYYFTLNETSHFWDNRFLTTQDVKWALKRAQSGGGRVNKWQMMTFTELQGSDSFIVAYGDDFKEDTDVIPMLLAALFEQA